MSSKLRVTLRKGLVGRTPGQRKTVTALGLRRIGQTVEKEDRPEIRGMLFKVRHMVEVEETTGSSGGRTGGSGEE